MERVGIVYFATGKVSGKHIPMKSRLVLSAIRVIGLSRMCHCMFGYNGVVVDPRFDGLRFLPARLVDRSYPTLCAVFRVPLKYGVDLDFFRYRVGGTMPMLPRLWRWLRGGHGPWVEDCLCTVLACLLAGGVDVPKRICTLRGLYNWLESEGYRHVTDSAGIDRLRKIAAGYQVPD